MEQKKAVVALRVFKGARLLKDALTGKIENENHVVKLKYFHKSWKNFMQMMPKHGYCKVDVVSVLDGDGEDWRDINFVNSVKEEVASSLVPKREVKQTPEQKEIAELKAQMAELLKAQTPVKEAVVEKPVVEVVEKVEDNPDELEALRDEYKKLFNKNAHHRLSVKVLRKKIEEKKNN